MLGGVVFVTGISGTGTREYLDSVLELAAQHKHPAVRHDIGRIMYRQAEQEPNLNVAWERILDADQTALNLLRALAFQEVAQSVRSHPDALHLIDLHLSFRWRGYLTRGFEPHLLEEFRPLTRLFVNLIEDVTTVQERLRRTAWGNRSALELLIWRDEELFLTDLMSDTFGLERAYVISTGELPTTLERLVWHPEYKKVYLTFPVVSLLGDARSQQEIRDFIDRIREFLIVFDPSVSMEYEETYVRPELRALRNEIGEAAMQRDYRLIEQADALVVYYPRGVLSQGVEAEIHHAHRLGRKIFLYEPEPSSRMGPFAFEPNHLRHDVSEYIELLKTELAPRFKQAGGTQGE